MLRVPAASMVARSTLLYLPPKAQEAVTGTFRLSPAASGTVTVVEHSFTEVGVALLLDSSGVLMEEILYKMQKKIVKKWLLEGHRVDGRKMNEIRPLGAEVHLIPQVHGSALFTRGQTQALSIATLSTLSDAQKIDTIWEEESKRFMKLPAVLTELRKAQQHLAIVTDEYGGTLGVVSMSDICAKKWEIPSRIPVI